MNQLLGHNSFETAHIVNDYPYGFKLRCRIAYWVETKPGKGQRFVSRTENPKTGKWNTPKYSTYSRLVVMYLDEVNHVKTDTVNQFTSKEDFEAFQDAWQLDEYQAKDVGWIQDKRRDLEVYFRKPYSGSVQQAATM